MPEALQQRRARVAAWVDELLDGTRLPSQLKHEARADFVAHLLAEIERELGAGRSADEAFARATSRFGDGREVRRALRSAAQSAARQRLIPRPPTGSGRQVPGSDLGWGLLRDLRFGLRGLIKAPGFALVAILTIALGVGANAAVFSVINAVLLRPLSYPGAEELVRVWPIKRFNEPMLTDLGERVSTLQGISAYRRLELTLVGEPAPEIVVGAMVPVSHFTMMATEPLLGRTFDDSHQWAGAEDVVVLSYALWRSRFGLDPEVIGRAIDLGGAGFARRRVLGVMPAGYEPLVADARLWVPLPMDPDSNAFQGLYAMSVVARMTPGATVQQASAEMRGLVPEFTEAYPIQFREERISPVDVVPLLDTIVGDARRTLLLLSGAVGLVLLIACSNVANLMLARANARGREIAIRVALGADRGRLVRQLLTESCLLSLLGGAAGLGLGSAMLWLLMSRIPFHVPRAEGIALDWEVLGFTLAASLLSGLVFGTAPAWSATQSDPGRQLIDGGRGSTSGRSRHLLNNGLVVLEIAVAMVLVIGASLLLKSLSQMRQVDAGFEADSVVAVQLQLPAGRYDDPEPRGAYFDAVIEGIAQLPGVTGAAGINLLPLIEGNRGVPYLPEGQELPPGTPSLVTSFRFVTPAYFDVLGMRLIQGRLLERDDGDESERVALANEAFARLHWGDGRVLGEAVRILVDTPFETTLRIVGVVNDVHQQRLDLASHPELYLPASQWGWDISYLVARSDSDPAARLADVRAAIEAVDPGVPIARLQPMPEVVGESLGDPRFYTELFTVFAALALSMGILGAYGVVSYTMAQRTQEIGIRIALGAAPGRILRYALARGMTPMLLGVVLGALLARLASQLLRGSLYGVEPADPAVFGGVAAVLALVGVAASWVPARRAAALDPVDTLRAE